MNVAVSDLVKPFDRFSQIFSESRTALRRLHREVRRAPDDIQILQQCCHALGRSGQRDEALTLVRDFMQRNGDRDLEGVGAILRNLQAYEMAELVYVRLAELHPDKAAPLCWLGIVHAKQGNATRAHEELEAAVELEPRNPETWYRLGTFHLRRRELDQAESCLRRALDVDATYARAHTNLGFLLDLRGERAAAIREFQRALQLAPDVPQNCFNLGALFAESGSHELAIEQFQSGVTLDPENVEGYYNLGAVFFEQRHYDDAIRAFRRALILQPEHPDALYYIGLSWLRKGVCNRALKHLELAARKGEPSLRLLYAIAQCYNGLEMPRQAVQKLSLVIAQSPDHAKAHHMMAICYDKLGERDRADEAYRKSDLFVTLARQRRGAARVGRA